MVCVGRPHRLMTPKSSINSHRGTTRTLLSAFVSLVLFVGLHAADNAKRMFDVPADNASRTLRVFAQQDNREIVFSVESVGAMKTNAVQGQMTPQEALEQRLANTGLVSSVEGKTGAFAVR